MQNHSAFDKKKKKKEKKIAAVEKCLPPLEIV